MPANPAPVWQMVGGGQLHRAFPRPQVQTCQVSAPPCPRSSTVARMPPAVMRVGLRANACRAASGLHLLGTLPRYCDLPVIPHRSHASLLRRVNKHTQEADKCRVFLHPNYSSSVLSGCATAGVVTSFIFDINRLVKYPAAVRASARLHGMKRQCPYCRNYLHLLFLPGRSPVRTPIKTTKQCVWHGYC